MSICRQAGRQAFTCASVSNFLLHATLLHIQPQVDRELPPGLSLEEDAEWIVDDKKHTEG